MFQVLLFGILIDISNAAEVCYGPCGCFNNDPPYNSQPLPSIPWRDPSQNGQDIKWELFTRANEDNAVMITIPEDGSDIPVPPEFGIDKPTVLLIHGWLSNSRVFDNIKDVLLNDFDFNILSVDWSTGAWDVYEQSASNVRVVGACSGAIIDAFMNSDVSQTHCVGHSLGAQTCGQMGKFLINQKGVTMARISGLDQATPSFDTDDLIVRMDKTDAEFVDIIRTTPIDSQNIENRYDIGHVNFLSNKAGRQPGCQDADDPDNCDHWACLPFYRDSIESREVCTYPSFPCDSFEDADACNCETCTEGVDCQSMGYYSNLYQGRGTFSLRTKPGDGPIPIPFCEEESPCAATSYNSTNR